MRLYINDVVEDCYTKKGHLIRTIIVTILLILAAILAITIVSGYKENQVIITENNATKGQIQSEINYVESQKNMMMSEQQNLMNGEESEDGEYFYPKKYADEIANIQNGFCTGDSASYISDNEIESIIKKQMQALAASGLVDSKEVKFLYPWFTATRVPYTWRCLTKIASTANYTPVVWECIDDNGYVYMIVIAKFDSANTVFTEFSGFLTYYGQSVINNGKTIDAVSLTSTEVANNVNNGNEYYKINMQPVADAIHDGKQFTSVEDIAALAETKIQ